MDRVGNNHSRWSRRYQIKGESSTLQDLPESRIPARDHLWYRHRQPRPAFTYTGLQEQPASHSCTYERLVTGLNRNNNNNNRIECARSLKCRYCRNPIFIRGTELEDGRFWVSAYNWFAGNDGRSKHRCNLMPDEIIKIRSTQRN